MSPAFTATSAVDCRFKQLNVHRLDFSRIDLPSASAEYAFTGVPDGSLPEPSQRRGLRLVLHRQIPEDFELRRRWNLLALETEHPQVFYTCEWALAMQSAYRATLRPLVFLGYDDDDLVGIASLASDLDGRKISFLAGTTADYCDLLSKPTRRAEFLAAVFEEISRLRPEKVALANLPADSETSIRLALIGRAEGFYTFTRPAYSCAQVQLGDVDQRQELKAAVSRKQMLQRKLRALERRGTVKYVHLGSWVSIQPALQTFAEAHAARFAATGRVSSLTTGERRNFIEDLARRFSDSGIVTLSILTVNDQAVAWNYGFQFAGSWFWYQPTFDRLWEECSPGFCLLARIIVDACDSEKISVVDLGLGEEGYKDRFANSARQTLHITLTKSWASHVREIARYRAASMVKRSPKIESAIRSALRR
jgi:CelD/BcsL family acetyltransferase involved in cellulose biosynthesis